MKRISFFYLISLISLLLLSGCGSFEEADVNDSSVNISHFEPLTDIKEGQTDIYLIIKVIDSSYWQVIVNGVKGAGEDLHCNIYYGGTYKETDWQGQKILIEEAISQNPDAVVLAPDDSIELSSDINRLHELGIPVALIDTAANTEQFDICYMTDNLFAGQNAAKEMISQLHEAGYSNYDELSVGIMVGTATSQTINERLAGFYQYWSNNAPGKWNIISDIMNCNGDVDQGLVIADQFLTSHPEAVGLYGTNNGPTRAICQVVVDRARTDLTVVGFDFSDEIKNLIESPDYRASTILQRQYYMGYYAVDSVLQILSGQTPPLRFVDTGVVTVNSETLSNPEVSEILSLN